jgi:hypothetical protein
MNICWECGEVVKEGEKFYLEQIEGSTRLLCLECWEAWHKKLK